MNEDIKIFLQDLYKLDPGLKNQEKKLVKLINQMLASRPNAKLDEQFAQALRAELEIKAEELKPSRSRVERVRFNNNNFNPMKKFAYAMSGAVICALLFVAVYYPINKNKIQISLKKDQINLDLGQLKISKLDSRAFGAINLENQNLSQSKELGIGAGGGGGMPVSSTQTIGMPAPMNYTYIYSGEEFQLEKEEALVYKYQAPEDSSKQFANMLKNTNFGLVDISKFSNLGLQNLTLAEDKDFGHMINIDLTRGTISVMENWTKWQQDDSKLNCEGDVKCMEESMMKIDDVPSDDKIIKLADDFFNQYGINKEHYGDPIIDDRWRVYYEQNKENMRGGIPETMQVTYPLVIDGQKVYEQGGYPVGLSVNVNIKYKKVAGVYGLRAENYQSATYNLEKNKEEILEIAKQGGIHSYFYGQDETSEIELDTPEFALIKVHNYSDNNQEEILAPGLIFDIKNKPDNYYGKQKIVVLLVKDILETSPAPEPRVMQ